MNKMIVYKTLKGGVFVPCDSQGNPDLTRVPEVHQGKLRELKWSAYTINTSYDKAIFAEVCKNGFFVQKIVVAVQEKE